MLGRSPGTLSEEDLSRLADEAGQSAEQQRSQNGTYVKLGPVDPRSVAGELRPLLVDGEEIHLAFKGIRDSVVFTNKRLIAINVQGLTGKKRDYSSLPLNKVQAWSVETAGTFGLDSELDLWFSGLGRRSS